jgi:hypothetical protein
MTAILTLFMGKMVLVVKIQEPLLMGREQIFPGLRALEIIALLKFSKIDIQ